jgi:16S rRNA (uracil1498-N3)-methyltransferase
MSLRSVYLPEPFFDNDRIRIRGDEHRHLLVARAASGEILEVFDGKENIWQVRVESVGKRETSARVIDARVVPGSRLELIMGLALIRMGAFELALEKLVEIGVTRIIPFVAARSNVAAGNRRDRWLRILIEAAKQSKRYRLPALDDPIAFGQILKTPAASKIMFAQHSSGSLKSALAGSPVLCLVGPEGGWDEAEIAAARAHDFHTVTLGASILKADTAAIAGASLIQYEMGE